MDVDMALSDIIKTSKAQKTTRRSSKFKKTQKKEVPRRRSEGIAKKTQRTPRRHSDQNTRNQVVLPGGDRRSVRVNISNLANSVVSNDLQELFKEFHIRKAVVNFDERGSPLGTADVETTKKDADRLIHKFTGVALDGKQMKFSIIETSNMAARVDFRGRKSFEATRTPAKSPKAVQKKKVVNKKKAQKKPVQKPKTTEELDAELDAYMSAAV